MSTVDFDSNLHASGFNTEGQIAPDALFDRFDVRRKGVVSSGQGIVKRGTVLGKVTASGEWLVSAAAAVDGSEEPRGVLLHDVDTTAADAEAIIGRRGRVGSRDLILGAGHTLASIDDALMDRGIILETIYG